MLRATLALGAMLLALSPAVGGQSCQHDIGEVLTEMKGVFIDIVDAPGARGYDQVLVMQVDDHLIAARLRQSCPVWPPVDLGKAPLRNV